MTDFLTGTIHNDINKKVDSGELPQATFSQNLEETQTTSTREHKAEHRPKSSTHIHLDKRKNCKGKLAIWLYRNVSRENRIMYKLNDV